MPESPFNADYRLRYKLVKRIAGPLIRTVSDPELKYHFDMEIAFSTEVDGGTAEELSNTLADRIKFMECVDSSPDDVESCLGN